MINANLVGTRARKLLAATALLAATTTGPLLAHELEAAGPAGGAPAAPAEENAPFVNEERFLWGGELHLHRVARVAGERFELSVADIVAQVRDAVVKWQKNDEDIPGQDGPTFVIERVGREDAGAYSAMISHRHGADGRRRTYLTNWHDLSVRDEGIAPGGPQVPEV